MKYRLTTILYYSLFWLVFFISSRMVFLFYNYQFAFEYPILDWLKTFLYGLKLDVSVTGYVLVIPTIMFSLGNLIPVKFQRWILNIYTLILLTSFIIIAFADAELYRNWGFKIDKTSLLYLKTPKEAMASSQTSLIIMFLLATIVSISGSYILYKRLISTRILKFANAGLKNFLLFFVFLALLFIPVRGGFDVATVNASSVYFHNDLFPNHAAVNATWNVVHSLTLDDNDKTYAFFEEDEMNDILKQRLTNNINKTSVLKTKDPNIIIIILESFTAEIIEPLGGEKGVSPNFTELCKEGILFNNFYANGSRSDKGIVSILSGFPAQPATSIIKYPRKTQNLPFINLDLKTKGYNSSFYYGGNLNFANIKSYFVNGSFDEIITGDDFANKLKSSKWGVPDHQVFDKFLNDLNKKQTPFFSSMFTLSSHDPFDIPIDPVFNGKTEDDDFKNSVYYTDQSLGNFIKKAKEEPWWENTVLILVADHGSRLPGNIKFNSLKKFHIPMLWIGGALNVTDTIITEYGSQVDISSTLLNQIDIPIDNYKYGKDILSKDNKHFSHFVFNDGFGYIDEESYYIYDNISERIIKKSASYKHDDLDFGKAYLQNTMKEFLK